MGDRMHDLLSRNIFLVKEHLGIFKAANNYDIYDPETGLIIMECREEGLGFFTKILRFTGSKRHTPFDVQIRTPDGHQVVRITRGISIFLSQVNVLDENDQYIGRFKQKFFAIGGAFTVFDTSERLIFQFKGGLTRWNYKFTSDEVELAHVTKKWAGIGQELFTSADNYVLEIAESVPCDNVVRQLILAAVMCIDMVFKE